MNLNAVIGERLHPIAYIKANGNNVVNQKLRLNSYTLRLPTGELSAFFVYIDNEGREKDTISISILSPSTIPISEFYDRASIVMPNDLLVECLGQEVFDYMKTVMGLSMDEGKLRTFSFRGNYAYVNIKEEVLLEFVQRLKVKYPHYF